MPVHTLRLQNALNDSGDAPFQIVRLPPALVTTLTRVSRANRKRQPPQQRPHQASHVNATAAAATAATFACMRHGEKPRARCLGSQTTQLSLTVAPTTRDSLCTSHTILHLDTSKNGRTTTRNATLHTKHFVWRATRVTSTEDDHPTQTRKAADTTNRHRRRSSDPQREQHASPAPRSPLFFSPPTVTAENPPSPAARASPPDNPHHEG